MQSIFGDRKTIFILLGPALLLYTLLKIVPVMWSFGLSFFEGNTLRGEVNEKGRRAGARRPPLRALEGKFVGQAFQPDFLVGQAFQPDFGVGQAFQPDAS